MLSMERKAAHFKLYTKLCKTQSKGASVGGQGCESLDSTVISFYLIYSIGAQIDPSAFDGEVTGLNSQADIERRAFNTAVPIVESLDTGESDQKCTNIL